MLTFNIERTESELNFIRFEKQISNFFSQINVKTIFKFGKYYLGKRIKEMNSFYNSVENMKENKKFSKYFLLKQN